MQTIYLIFDDDELIRHLKEYFEIEGYQVKAFNSIKSAEHAIAKSVPDATILDLDFSDGSGFSFIKKVREKEEFAIIIVTKRNEESDRILGFELGCDDYITIPFSHRELLLRLNSILKRKEKSKEDTLKCEWTLNDDRLYLERDKHIFFLNKKLISLTASEWKILAYLSQNDGLLISRSRILDNCFDVSDGYERVIDTHVKNIRAKIGKDWIETVRGYGYKFTGEKNLP